MAKDSYWFRHDSTAGRGTRMRKMTFIYGHWGKGIYWDVIEILRDQDGYCFEKDETSLQMLADIIGCKEPDKFVKWFNDCVRLDLLQTHGKSFYSEVLNKNMEYWEVKKENGEKGGRPKKPKKNLNNNLNETESKANQNHNITEHNITEQNRTNNLIDFFFSDFPNSTHFESICRIQKIEPAILLKQLEVFRVHAELSYPTFEKFASHFKNWVKKNPPNNPEKPKMQW
jgi:hypothetical protein